LGEHRCAVKSGRRTVRRTSNRAWQALREAHAVAGIGLAEAAGRPAHLAAFHAAQALIFDRSAKVPKTHRGVHAQFTRRAKDIPKLGADLPRFLSQAYGFKAVADYEIGRDGTVPLGEAISATNAAENFIDRIAELFENAR
jgi:uncharacterized protein (UPF0332 family)